VADDRSIPTPSPGPRPEAVAMSDDDLDLPDPIDTPRLTLQVLTIEAAQALTVVGLRLANWHPEYPRDDDVDAASLVVTAGVASSWGPRQIVTTADGLVVGTIGFLGPPSAVAGVPEAELGYGLVPAARKRGLATEAVAGIVAAAECVSVAVRATVAPENGASRRVLDRCGFRLVSRTDDGQLLVRRRVRR